MNDSIFRRGIRTSALALAVSLSSLGCSHGDRAAGESESIAGRPQLGAALRADFEPDGAEIEGVGWRFAGAAAAPRRDGDRVVYDRPNGTTEWYSATARGVEQGFTVSSATGSGIAIRGTIDPGVGEARAIPGGLAFGAVTYDGLHAWDANHADLSASMAWDAATRAVTLSIPEASVAGARFPVTIDPLFASHSWTTEPADDSDAQYGFGVAVAGDVNGDGYGDVLVGAPGCDQDAANEGRAYLFYGGSSGLSTSPAWSSDPTDTANANYGYALAGVGDLNADGYDDFVVGARGMVAEAAAEGRVYVYFGSSSGPGAPAMLDPTNQAGAHFGATLAGAGDVNGDGYADVVVGAPDWDSATTTNEGRAYVYRGSPSGLESTPSWENSPTGEDGARYGFAVASAGDVNGDGRSDVVVGAPYWGSNDEGRAYEYTSGPTGPSGTAASWTSDPTDQLAANFGWSVAGADADGDGYSDVVVGAPGWDTTPTYTDEGRVYQFAGSAAGLSASPTTQDPADQSDALFGQAVAAAGDVNGDGFADFAVGAPRWDGAQADQGRCWLLFGKGGSAQPGFTANPTNTVTSFFGAAVAGGVDVDGDGFGDVIVGAYQANGSVLTEGRAYLYRGYAGAFSATFSHHGTASSTSNLGRSVDWAGDVNGDGYDDLLVGEANRARLYYGSATGVTTVGQWVELIPNIGFGQQVAGLGDVDNDGFSDFVVGAPNENGGQGRVHFYRGSTSGPVAAGSFWDGTSFNGLGQGLAGGDFNGDGYADLAAASASWIAVFPGSAAGLGAMVFSAAVGGLSSNIVRALASAGDVNGDGLDDLLVGRPNWDTGSAPAQTGRVDLYLGNRDLTALAVNWTSAPTGVYAHFGSSVAGAGDVNHDGYGDVVVGAPEWTNGPTSPGRAYVFHGTSSGLTAGPVRVLDGISPSDFGAAVVGIGDANGDGFDDIAVGDPTQGINGSGRVSAYFGAAAGIPATEGFAVTGPLAGDAFGSALAGGDASGDGFGDFVVGDWVADYGLFSSCCEEGRIDVYYGGDGLGLGRRMAEYQVNGTTRIATGGRPSGASIVLEARATQEPGLGGTLRLEFEVKRVGVPFDGKGTVRSGIVVSGQAGQVTVNGLTNGASYHWRVRVLSPVDLVAGHWSPYGGNNEADADFRIGAVDLGKQCSSAVECTSGFCVDGVCCNNACGGGVGTDCRVCSIAAGGASNGVCGAVIDTSVTCRPASGACDEAETCDGASLSCPPDAFAPASTVCRTAVPGGCDQAETCPGSGPACPVDAFRPSGTACRASADVCDAQELCSGTSSACPADKKVGAGTVCRSAAGGCDTAETCDGATNACPSDAKVPAGTQCRASAGACDVAEACDGSSPACPSDAKIPSGTPCRAAADVCDVAESCDGASAACPFDAKRSAGTLCRASAGSCDTAEVCNGSAVACPADSKTAKGTVCRASAGTCDVAEACDGAADDCPADAKVSSGTVCRTSTGPCDPAETCDGSSALCAADAKTPKGTVCRSAAGACDAPETCDGANGNCASDAMVAGGTPCRAAAGVCDVAEACNGVTPTCPPDAKLGSGSVCRAAAGACDLAETCDGTGVGCPTNAFLSASSVCRAGSCSADAQIAPTTCNGSASCPAAPPPSSCGAYVCGSTRCLDTCLADTDCATGNYCKSASCTAKLSAGSRCAQSNECQSAHCVDGFCCDTGCTAQCEACDVSGKEGTCSAVTGDPHGGRSGCAGDGSVCDGACDGTKRASCTYPSSTQSCRAAQCTAGQATLEAFCDGAGSCPALQTQACPFGCLGTACSGGCPGVSCSPAEYCSAGVCVAKLADGDACASSAQCENGHCVDGVCCNTTCAEQCAACDVSGSVGTCTPVTGAPAGGRAACAGIDECAGSCDGVDATACAYPDAAKLCGTGSCSNGVQADPACDGAGSCSAGGQISCGAFGCGATACLGMCSVDGDCAPGFVCSGTACVAPPPPDAGAGGSTGLPEAGVPPDSGPATDSGLGPVDAATSIDGRSPNGRDASASDGRAQGTGGAPASSGGGAGSAPTGGTAAATGGRAAESGGSAATGGEAGADAGLSPFGVSGDEGGCGCRTAPRVPGSGTLGSALVLAALLARRRARRIATQQNREIIRIAASSVNGL